MVSNVLDKLHLELQGVEARLRIDDQCYAMTTMRLCMSCGRKHPGTAKKCHPCKSSTLYHEHCTTQSRIAEYFAVMSRSHLWPSVAPFKQCSVYDLVGRFASARKDRKHTCDAGSQCPLHRELESLYERVKGIVDHAKGVRLDRQAETCKWSEAEMRSPLQH